MIVNSERAMVLFCPACQRMQSHVFSLFQISKAPQTLVCECGFSQGKLEKTAAHYQVDLLNAAGERIRLRLPRRTFVYAPFFNLTSPRSGQHVGYLGSPDQVLELASDSFSNFLPAAAEIVNPEIMEEILGRLQELAERGKIRCECEQSSIGIDVYAERVELVCSFCGSVVQISACCPEDQERLARITEIVMEPCTSLMLSEWLKPLT